MTTPRSIPFFPYSQRFLSRETELLEVMADVCRRGAYILQKDCAALWQYLVANPSIMSGNDALARELRTFVAATERGQLNCFAARPTPKAVVPPTAVISFAATNAVVY